MNCSKPTLQLKLKSKGSLLNNVKKKRSSLPGRALFFDIQDRIAVIMINFKAVLYYC
jgi:hypothetical protein